MHVTTVCFFDATTLFISIPVVHFDGWHGKVGLRESVLESSAFWAGVDLAFVTLTIFHDRMTST
jgi:hypothetical protein